jgi:hypothetical protein
VPRFTIAQLEITESTADKLWSHRIVARQVRSVLFGRTVVTRNRSGRAAPYVLLGRDEQGRCLAIPIVPTDDPVVWRVVTAWYCKLSEAAKLR